MIPTAPHFIGVKDDGSFRDISISSKSPAIANYPKSPNNVITENNRFMVSNDMTMYTCTPGQVFISYIGEEFVDCNILFCIPK